MTPEPVNARLFDGRTGDAQAVAAILSGNTLQLRGADGALIDAWPATSLLRTDPDAPSGATLRLVSQGRLANGETSRDARLVLDDTALLAPLAKAGARLHRGPSPRGLGIAAAIIGTVIAFLLLIDQAPSVGAMLVPRALEQQWSNALEASMTGRRRACDAPGGTAAIAGLMDRLATSAGLPAPRFVVLDSPLVNAFTLPDGRIVIYSGLIAEAGDGDAFAGVMAHEMGHVLHHDPTREALRGIEISLIARGLGWGGNVARALTSLTYSRRAETAADASALDTLRKAGLRADGLGRFFAKLQAKEHAGAAPAFLSDHPSNADRERAVHVDLTGDPMGDPAFTAGQWAAITAICAKAPP